MKEKPSSISKHAGPDFDTYDLSYDGQRFSIYEGNYPSSIKGQDWGPIPRVSDTGFVEGKLYNTNGRFAVVLRTPQSEFPQFVEVSTSSDNLQKMDRFLSELRAKQRICQDCPH